MSEFPGIRVPEFRETTVPGKGIKKLRLDAPDNIYIAYREKSWMSEAIMKTWVNTILVPRRRKIQPGKRGLLLLDGLSIHTMASIKKAINECNFDVLVLPPKHNISPSTARPSTQSSL